MTTTYIATTCPCLLCILRLNMSSSFPYPQHLLHGVIEPQWFPDRKQETESALTAIEAAEEAHMQYLHKIVTEFSPIAGAVVIGKTPITASRSSTPSGRRNRQRRTTAQADAATGGAAAAAAPVTTPTATTTAVEDASNAAATGMAMMMMSPPPISSSQRFWNRTSSARRLSSGTNRTTVQQHH